jgi:pimeloyl-ACP methyl ester carboxylesterase
VANVVYGQYSSAMDIILVPGFWLDANSWSGVTPRLTANGHRVHPLTLPGLESQGASRAGIGLIDHVDAVVAAIDEADGPIVLVGHSGGTAIIHAAADARPDRVVRTVHVDGLPMADGDCINDGLPAEGDEIPLPPWEFFDDADLVGLADDVRAAFRAVAIPEPRGVAYDAIHLHDERRYDVPATIISCEFPSSQLVEWVGQDQAYVAELARMREVEYVDLPTGHWPQFTRPDDLGATILAAVERTNR